MAAIHISDVIGLIPESKLNTSSVCNAETEFDVTLSWQSIWGKPVGFPSLDQAILPDDTVCIPVEPGIPGEALIASNTVRSVHEIGVPQNQITVLLPEGATDRKLGEHQSALALCGCPGVEVHVHEASRPESQGYLGPSESGEPISLNARLVHADFVLPISRARAFGYQMETDFLYPCFSGQESQKRFFQLNREGRVSFNQEVHRWLGNCVHVSVAARRVIGTNGENESIFGMAALGETRSVNSLMRDYFLQIKAAQKANGKFDLVIAGMNSPLCLSIEEILEFSASLSELCKPGGSTIALWDDFSHIPALVDFDGQESSNEQSAIAGDGHHCFMSTEQPLLRQIGISQVTRLSEIERLVQSHDSILVLPDFINDFAYHQTQDFHQPG